MQVAEGDGAQQPVAGSERPERLHVGMHDGIQADMGEGARGGADQRDRPRDRGVADRQPSQDEFADRLADDAERSAIAAAPATVWLGP